MTEASVVQDVQQVPSPAPANVLSTLTPDQRSEWRKTGELPKVEEKKDEAQESEVETSDATEQEAESSTASEAGKSQESKPRHNAETRIRDLNAKLKAAQAELEQLKKAKPAEETKKAEPSPAKAAEPEFKPPVKPKQADFDGSPGKTWEDYEEARDKYFEDLAEYKAEAKARQIKAEQAQQSELQKTSEQLKEARSRYKDFDDVAKPLIAGLANKDTHPDVLRVLNSTKNIADVLYTIGGNEGEVQKLTEAAKDSPIEAIRLIARYEYLVEQELSKGTEAKEKKAPETPVTKAPKPVTEVGGRGVSTEDPALASVRANDYRATKALWTRQALEGK